MIEKSGIPAVSITLLRELTVRVRPPRALFVDRPLGYPLGAPRNIDLQKRIVIAALEMLSRPVEGPLLVDFEERA